LGCPDPSGDAGFVEEHMLEVGSSGIVFHGGRLLESARAHGSAQPTPKTIHRERVSVRIS
jgi:hypothetical protein